MPHRPSPVPGRRLRLALSALLAAVLLLAAPALLRAQDAGENPPVPAAVLAPGTPLEALVLRLLPLTEPELAAAAAAWQTRVQAKTAETAEAQIAVMGGADPATVRLAELKAERKALFDRYAAVLDAWEKKGGDPAAVQKLRDYRTAILVDETRTATPAMLAREALDWLLAADGGLAVLKDLAVVAAAFVGLVIAARFVRGLVRRWIGRVPNLSRLMQAFIVVAIYWVVLAIGLMVVLSALGVDVTPVFALIGGASFILAFALQSTLGNLASGLMIMINRPFDEGDYVDVGGVAGTVRSVSIMSTTVVTPDNQVIVIPNANVWGNVITNVTISPTRRVDLTFGIAYEDSIEKAQAVLEQVVAAHPLVLEEPAPVIRVGALGPSSVDFICRPWVKGADYWTVHWDLTRQVKEAFDAAGISIPYPQQDLHVRTAVAPAALTGAASPPSARKGAPTDAPAADGDAETP
ncbi:mechanosensitive ion channel family protein [Albimonas pacifica]|uniref:Small-conductance mechanosensitive channel n=1 Tax=Albimonas pacifica TaxID=1114924 RepID=A0A1I3EDQ4_9RHOB|nr:mechanosensitive ion channel family protein [Albimonas pacifica]SFH97085.1 small conductance mechanosensitive channel [Albimonas pacifica]